MTVSFRTRTLVALGLALSCAAACGCSGPAASVPVTATPADESADDRIARLGDALFCPCEGAESEPLRACSSAATSCFEAQLAIQTLDFYVRTGAPDEAAMDAVMSELEALEKPNAFTLDHRPRIGSADARVQLVVFEDFQCPACRRLSNRLPDVLEQFGGSVSLVFKHFPLPRHTQATLAAQAAIAAHLQGAFWPFQKLVFEHQSELSEAKLFELAESLSLDVEKLRQDMKSPATEALLAQDIADGVRAKLPGTPTLFINGVDAGDALTTERLTRRIELEMERQALAGTLRSSDRVVAQDGGAPAKAGKTYPTLAEFMPLLNEAERARLFRIAESEICPCSDKSIASLDACLQKEDGECVLAVALAKTTMRAIKEGESDAAIVDKLVKEVQSAKTVHAFDLSKTPHKGADPAKAKLTIVEFADFGCHYCSEAAKKVAKIAKDYPDDVTVYFKQYPLNPNGPSVIASMAALAAHQQGKFWPMHDLLFASQPNIGPDYVVMYAQQLGIDIETFSKHLQDPSLANQIQQDRTEGENAGITGTPAFYIDGVRFMGDFDDLEQSVKDRIGK